MRETATSCFHIDRFFPLKINPPIEEKTFQKRDTSCTTMNVVEVTRFERRCPTETRPHGCNLVLSSTHILSGKIGGISHLTQYVIISTTQPRCVSGARLPHQLGLPSCTARFGHQTPRCPSCDFRTHLAAMTGIHGVSSSEWLPINQSTSGKRVLSLGVIAAS